jgi:hypothetical protein
VIRYLWTTLGLAQYDWWDMLPPRLGLILYPICPTRLCSLDLRAWAANGQSSSRSDASLQHISGPIGLDPAYNCVPPLKYVLLLSGETPKPRWSRGESGGYRARRMDFLQIFLWWREDWGLRNCLIGSEIQTTNGPSRPWPE